VAGADVSEAIRLPRVTERVSQVAALPEVRDWVNRELRDLAAQHPRGVVMEGRDIGTVVFPDAALKVFLVASPEERARRRLLQDGTQPNPARLREAARELERRDRADASREVAPLAQAPDAVVLDTTGLGFEEQVDRIVELARNVFS
jgi:cytidylate kinase